MASRDPIQQCNSCGYTTSKWMGFCPQCRTHGSLNETGRSLAAVTPLGGSGLNPQRIVSGLGEFDRVLGGGFVDGSVVLVGGEPGVGKSTLLLQLMRLVAEATDRAVLYASGEESAAQISLRAERLDAIDPRVLVMATGDFSEVEEAAARTTPALVVVDSVQTMRADEGDGIPGAISQVRATGAAAARLARSQDVPVVLVGHVTKEGHLAGPKVLEHLVDVTLLLEGDPDRGLRYVRVMKNRHGSVDQVGVFEMSESGLRPVEDPGSVFVSGWSGAVPGTVLYPAMFGRRTLLVEVQALVAPNPAPQPRRSAKGVPANRVHQLLAVLDRHCGITCADHDVYVNVIGGLSLREPAVDLAVALAVASSRTGSALGPVAAFGEVGLVGEVRSIAHEQRRRREIERFGVEHVVAPPEYESLLTVLQSCGIERVPGRPKVVPMR